MDRKLTKELQKYVETISQKYPLKGVYLFGSQAKGTTTKDSDIDLLIISSAFEKMRPLRRSVDLRLMWKVLYPMDLVCVTPKEFNSAKKSRGTLVHEIIEHGIKIA